MEDHLQMLHKREREIILKVSSGIATFDDAVFLAELLNHADLFSSKKLPPPNENEPE